MRRFLLDQNFPPPPVAPSMVDATVDYGPVALDLRVLRRLGGPPGLEAASDELQAAVRDAAVVAWELLDSDADPVVGALRQHGPTSARLLAELLDEPIETIRAELQRLRREGAVSVRGRGPGTRYQPSR